MQASEYIRQRLPQSHGQALQAQGRAFAPSNIALVKYWGKRDTELHLPLTDSLSLSLDQLGATTTLVPGMKQDSFKLNGKTMDQHSLFAQRLTTFLDYFRCDTCPYFDLSTDMNIPMSAGLASSACGYAALTEALNALFDWQLDRQTLSQISRLGSGSASRSHWQGFVHWHAGKEHYGADCYAEPIYSEWQDIRIAILPNETTEKAISSRTAMAITMANNSTQQLWKEKTHDILEKMQQALENKNFPQLGNLSQQHADAMHSLMQKHSPSIDFNNETSRQQKQQIIALQKHGHNIYYTQDAGPHIKVLLQNEDCVLVKQHWAEAIIINPWSTPVE